MHTAPVLWICIGLFFVRVIGQLEVLLLEPAWLPPWPAWYSGLLPYPVLLPAQIALLMLMCVLAARTPGRGTRPSSGWAVWRPLAWIYFAVMAARLAWCVQKYGHDFYLHGAIPVAFHWVLALFLLVWARDRAPQVQADRSSSFV